MGTMKYLKYTLVAVSFVAALVTGQLAGATDITRGVLQTDGVAKPNVIFGMDDSGSMDFEVLLDANDGAFWWDKSADRGWDNAGRPNFNPRGTADTNFFKFAYLFPNGCSQEWRRHLCDSGGHYAILPSSQMAWTRSSDYNPLYYDPTETYNPWPTATVNGTSTSFPAAAAAAAAVHPLYPSKDNVNLTQDIAANTGADYRFLAPAGMEIPKGASYVDSNNQWKTASNSPTKLSYDTWVTMAYYPATYWVKIAGTCPAGATCTAAPDGKTLQRYEIRSTNSSYPTGRSYAAEMQNFANWFTYYRKRKLMLASSMGLVMGELTGMRLGVVPFNVPRTSTSKIKIYDTDSSDPALNGKAVAGLFYNNLASGGTPTRETLDYIGRQLKDNADIIQYSCQRNAAFVVTDGFANATATTPRAYDNGAKWGAGKPYTTRYADTLSDIALAYYTINPRADLPLGRVPAAIGSLDPSADKNPDLHMNTYAITLGASGTLWPAIGDPYKNTPAWPNPNLSQSQTAVDDLFHATVNGRGDMFMATNPKETAKAVNDTLKAILRLSGSQSGVTYSTVNLKAADSFAYLGSYKVQGWSGDIEAFNVDPKTAEVAKTASWSANTRLQAKDWATRLIASYNGSSGVAFAAADAALTDYLRGDRSKEGSTYRTRSGLMGAVINAEPVVSSADGMVYATSNEGMLHALDKATGEELWAYVPSFGVTDMGDQAVKGAVFKTVLDGTPVLAKVGTRAILIGGRGTAGSGYYALDVTSPKTDKSDADVAKRVLWEFPNASTSADVRSKVGTSVGRPLIVKTDQYGWVALVTSGYNSAISDGKARLFVLDLLTGEVKATLEAQGAAGTDPGLAQISGWLESNGLVQYVYGGDEQGNLWRFDLGKSAGTPNPLKMATLVGPDKKASPITVAPELTLAGSRRLVLVGTGRLLGSKDFSDNRQQSFFAIQDASTTLTDVRTQLEPRTATVTGPKRTVTGKDVDWTTKSGWYVDLPAGEKANTDPSLAFSVIAFTTNQPSQTACNSNSALYLVEASTGKELPADNFVDGSSFFGINLASTLASRASIARTSTGKIAVTSRQSDGTTNTRLLNIKSNIPAQKTGWREVLR
jgi:type IV pilus assembly protein PilY1